jgi:nucleoside-diphosphate-sugar epimerase
VEFVEADVRDAAAVRRACRGVDSVCHFAFINGTEYFYSQPELVLDVGVKGMMNVLDGCRAENVGELVLASSSEVYQTPPSVPTDERVPMSIPDPLNPRYSYGGGKIISELLAINYGRKHFERVLIVRPHNVYGPAMGWEHVIPQFVLRMKKLCENSRGPIPFPIQGTGEETRAFVYVDDFTVGVTKVIEQGGHLGIYNVGTSEEKSIREVAEEVGRYFGREVRLQPGALREGGTSRRCPDIRKIQALGYQPEVSFRDGVKRTADWYIAHAGEAPP